MRSRPFVGREVGVPEQGQEFEPRRDGTITVPLTWFNQVMKIYYAAQADRLVPQERELERYWEQKKEEIEAQLTPRKTVLSDLALQRPLPNGVQPRGALARKLGMKPETEKAGGDGNVQ